VAIHIALKNWQRKCVESPIQRNGPAPKVHQKLGPPRLRYVT